MSLLFLFSSWVSCLEHGYGEEVEYSNSSGQVTSDIHTAPFYGVQGAISESSEALSERLARYRLLVQGGRKQHEHWC